MEYIFITCKNLKEVSFLNIVISHLSPCTCCNCERSVMKNFMLTRVSCVLPKNVSKSLGKTVFKIWFIGENNLMEIDMI